LPALNVVLTKLENEWCIREVRLDGLGPANKMEIWHGKTKEMLSISKISE
jgi:hypothetical protein